jgi:hypothetical protein
MFAWLVHHKPGNAPDYIWQIDNLNGAPAQLRELVDHARRFHTAIHGAALVYNLLLARKVGREAAIDAYEDRVDQWRDELHATRALDGWDRGSWWATIRRQNPNLRFSTIQFVNRWLDLLATDDDVARSFAASNLVSMRERQIKGGRARLVNQSALDRWSGGSGLGRHDFRWTVARPHLQDLYAARTTA